MGVRTNILAIVPLSSETATCSTSGCDLAGNLNFAAEACADAVKVLNAIADFLPSGSNLTAVQTAITALT